ncbi:MAG: autotransporter-associated beta strand repeat-containing protein, partial [Planctomycetia bacterium]|nr:autotransporter-associated beta strand repeat-containing protein [Planctomycetia bacterium]
MAWDNASQNSTANLNFGIASNVTFTGAANLGGRSAWGNQGQGIAHVSVADGSVVNFGSAVFMGGQSSLNLNSSGQVNAANDVYFGGQGYATTVTLGVASQLNMTGSGRTLAFADGDYSSLKINNTPAGGRISVTSSTNLNVRPQGADATVAFGAASNGLQLSNLFLGTDVNSSNTANLNVAGATVTFSGSAELGSHYGDNGGRWNNAANTAINVTNGGVLNIGGNLTAGGWSSNAQTSAALNVDATSQINLTGKNNRIDIKGGTTTAQFTNTPTNGAVSLQAQSHTNAGTDLWLSNALDNFPLNARLNFAAGTNVQFHNLRMAWDNASAGSQPTMGLQGGAQVTFTGDSYIGGNPGNQGSAVITGNGTLTFNQTLNMGRTHVEANGGTLTLNFPSYNRTETSNVMNTPVGTGLGANSYAGWYASNGGKLVLPNLTVTNSTSQLDWGDVSNNAMDINRNVNSIRLTNLNVTGGGTNNLGISLLDVNNAETFSGLHGAIGIWKFDPTGGLNITSALMAFRYDTAAMAALQLPDSSFNLYENFGTGWKLLQSSPQDQGNHLISGTGTLINANGPYPYVQFAIAQTVAASGGVVWNGASSGPGDNNWTTAANWVGNAAPTPGSNNDQDLVHFAGSQRTSAVNDFAPGSSFSGILFGQDATASFSLTGNAIVLNGDVTNSSNLSHNIALNMALAHATTVVDSGSNNNQVVTLSGNLSDNGGPAGITKLGNGSTLVLSGSNTNTGAILISEGTVSVGSIGMGGAASNLGAASNAASNLVMDGGRLQYTGAGDTTDRNFTINNGKVATFDITNAAAKLVLGAASNVSTGTLTKTGAGTLALTGQSQYTGATTVTGGALSVGDGGSGNSLATSGITFSNGAKLILNQSDSSTFSTPFSGAAGLIKDGTGTVTLPGVAGSYTGATEIKNGTLRLVPASPVSNGLQAWFAANKNVTTSGTQVTTWGDISGNGHDAVLGANTSTLAAGQINGLPAVQFRNSWLDINTNMTVGSEYIVVKSGAYTYDPGNPNHFGPDWSAAIGRQDGGGWLFWPGQTGFWDGNSPSAVSQNGTPLASYTVNGLTNVDQYMVLKVDTNNVANTLYTLGRNGGWTNGYLDVAEVLAFDHVLTSGDEAKVGGYLATKYGIGTAYAPYSLPDALPANTPVSISTGATLD